MTRGKRLPINHELKTDWEWFSAVLSGYKTAELRRNDRDFRRGDTLTLVSANSDGVPRRLDLSVTHVLTNYPGLEPGYAMVSFRPARSALGEEQ